MTTVRDATFDVMRAFGLTRVFGNPGSSEIPFLTDFPDDLEFVLGLHEGAVVGMASGYALGTGRPAFVNLHTSPGLGNAVNAIVCARDNRIPLVIVVGQQDRRQLGLAPFLTGRNLERLAGDYPVWSSFPAHPVEVPGAVARAYHEASLRRGPAVVIAPMGDWAEPMPPDWEGPAAPDRVLHAPLVDPAALQELASLVASASAPAIVVGAGCDTPAGWAANVALAERLSCPVWQDTFSSRMAFPQDHALFAGHLPWRRSELRALFAENDLVLVVGTPSLRLYLHDPGPLFGGDTRVAVVGDDPDEVLRSRADLALLGPPAVVCAELAARVPQREGEVQAIERPGPPPADGPLTASHILAALAERLPADAILVEESPSTRPEMLARIAIREPLGFVAVANGALGFGIAASVGLKMALPERPVVALLGDGSATYAIQSLWSAARYGAGTVFVVVGNASYGVMDELARLAGGTGAWPSFPELDLATVAQGFGCPSERVTTHERLTSALDEAIAARRDAPLLLDVRVT